MCHFVRISCSICRMTMKRDPINCGRGLAVLGPAGLIFECPTIAGDAGDAEEVLRENGGICDACEEEKARDLATDPKYRDILSWKRKPSP